MKLLLLGDCHLKMSALNRSDKIWETQLGKLRQVFKIAEEHKVAAIVQVGDLFNSPEPPNELVAELIALLRSESLPSPLLTVLGQHDKYMRTGLKRSPTRILVEAGLARLLGEQGERVGEIELYGCDFGEPAPSPSRRSGDVKRVLAVHAAIYPDPLYPNDTGFTIPRKFLSDSKAFDLVVCGDYHGSFDYQLKNGRAIVNPGAMTRQTKADVDNLPQVMIWDSETFNIDTVLLPDVLPSPFIQKPGSVERDDSLDRMLGALRIDQHLGISFEDELMAYLKQHDIDEGARTEILSAMEKAANV